MKNYKLTMQTAAGWWRDGLPVGNGALGAMVYGRVAEERILLNHEKLWYDGVSTPIPDVAHLLEEQRKLVGENRYVEANDIYFNELTKRNWSGSCASYHPAADILINQDYKCAFNRYQRTLDLTTACAKVEWVDGDTDFSRRTFVSRVNDFIATEIAGSKANSVSCKIALVPHDLSDALDSSGNKFVPPIAFNSTITKDKKIHFMGKYTRENGVEVTDGREYGVAAKVINFDGEISVEDNFIVVKNATKVVIYVNMFIYEDGHSFCRLDRALDELSSDFDMLLDEHVALHKELFLRTKIDLCAETTDTPNEQLLLEAYRGKASVELIEKMADYGRYLLIGSSRPKGLPSNLQGIWNGDYAPPWACFFMINENLQMNYWQSLPGQLPETLLAVVDFYTSYMADFRTNAKQLYGCKGIFIPSLMSPDTGLAVHKGSWIINWISGAGWLAQHFFDYYLYTNDEDYLRDRALPFMAEIAEFYADFLYKGSDGKLVFCPSISPENWPIEFNDPENSNTTSGNCRVTCNATMDVAIARELLTNLLTGAKKLSLYSDKIELWSELLDDLPEYTLNEDGAVREWVDERFSDNYYHRHQSHIYPVFPGNEINAVEHPELQKAFKVAVDKRLVIGLKDQTGWSLSHMANINARLGDGDTAVECLDILSRSCIGKNFFTYHNDYREMGITNCETIFGKSTPFQIDANMGWTSSIYEMLVYSTVGMVKLFPALPKRLSKGSITNIKAKGGFTLSLEWNLLEDSFSCKIDSTFDANLKLVAPSDIVYELTFSANESKTVTGKFSK